MAGLEERLSPFLRAKLQQAEVDGDRSSLRVITSQYLVDVREAAVMTEESDRHYQASVDGLSESGTLTGVERLYKRSVVIMPTNVCAAHCRWCLRARYGSFVLSDEELRKAARYCGDNPELREVLISGGDPLMTPARLRLLLDYIQEDAANIQIIRVASRVPVQAPERINSEIVDLLRNRGRLRVEVGIHVNHATELFPEVRDSLTRVKNAGAVIYAHSVLLKGVNDNKADLVGLYDALRSIGVEPHYLFHCVPMKGMGHHRTSLRRGLELIKEVSNGGELSGRAKPMYAAMTDIGKITLYDGVLLGSRDGSELLQSSYSYELRRRWNPEWKVPASASVGEDGCMRVWYLNGSDH